MSSVLSTLSQTDDIWLCPDLVFDGQNLLSDSALHLAAGKLGQLKPRSDLPENAQVAELAGILTPGFFDVQVNGGGGVLYNTSPTPEGLFAIAKAHRKLGTTALLPTVITDAPQVLEDAVEAMKDAYVHFGIQGIHIEGPHISIARRGTHEAQWVRSLTDCGFERIRQLRDKGIPVLITVAPESLQKGDVAKLVEMGVVVSIGHTDATAAQIKLYLEEGANLFTHLFNGMSQMLNREPGAVGTGINSSAYCSIIADGHHVADDMLQLAMRAKPEKDRMILISDAMPTVGGPDVFELYGNQILLKDGKLINKQGSLAGAHVTMLESVAYVVEKLGRPLEETLRMAVTNPSRLMGVEGRVATLEQSDLSNIVLMSSDFKSFSPLA